MLCGCLGSLASQRPCLTDSEVYHARGRAQLAIGYGREMNNAHLQSSGAEYIILPLTFPIKKGKLQYFCNNCMHCNEILELIYVGNLALRSVNFISTVTHYDNRLSIIDATTATHTKNTNHLLTLHLIITSRLLLLRFTSSYHYSLQPSYSPVQYYPFNHSIDSVAFHN